MKIIRVERDRNFNETEFPIEVEGTKEECFSKFYNMNRTYRYCNDIFYKFADKSDDKDYDNWYDSLSKSTRFDMYYGNSTVD